MKFTYYLVAILIIAVVLVSDGPLSANQENDTIKIMTYNIWNGFDWGKDTVRRANCINWIRSKEIDVLAIQELCGYDSKKLKEDALQWGHPYVQILKTKGYPTAITSNRPIQLKERAIDSFWHGMLHCETYGIDFFIVHLSPSDSDIRLEEARQISKKIDELGSDSFIILGDFNALSPMDAAWIEGNLPLKEKYAPKEEEKYSNLRNGEFDYAVISEFLALPSMDVCVGKINLQDGFTFPTPALIGEYSNTPQTIVENRVRIDYILTSPSLAKSCIRAEVLNQKETHTLSDHYPVWATFNIPTK